MLLTEIQNNQFFSTYKETKNWLDQMGVHNYTIKPNTLEVTVNGDVHLPNFGLTTFPVKFKKVTGNFYCNENELISLIGCPDVINETFICTNNRLTSLQGAPKYVGGACWFSYNDLSTLHGAPDYVGSSFVCTHNKLTSLQYAPSYIFENFNCSYNNLNTLKGAPPHIAKTLICNGNNETLRNITKFIKSVNSILIMEVDPNLISFMWCFRIKSLVNLQLHGANMEQHKVAAIINKHLKDDRSGPACQIELIDAGLGKYIKL